MNGDGKCIVCKNGDIAHAEVSIQVTTTTQEDLPYFENIDAHACKHCGFIQLTSKKVNP